MTPEELRQIQEMDRLADLEAAEVPTEQKARVIQEGELPTQPSVASEVETNQINEQAKSPYQSTQAELVQDQVQASPLEDLMAKSNTIREKASADIKTAQADDRKRALLANAVKALGTIGAADIQRKVGVDVGLKDFQPVKVADTSKGIKTDRDTLIKQLQDQYKTLQAGKITPYQQATLDEAAKKRESAEKIATEKIAGKVKDISKLDLEKKKSEMKRTQTLEKENRKVREDSVNSLKDIDKQIDMVKKAAKMMQDSAKSGLTDTGPLDQYLAPMGNQGQKLRQTFNEISLDKMTKMFAGMSKAIDSDAERKFFEQSQVSMGNYPEVNMGILKDTLKNLESLKAKSQGVLQSISKEGKRSEDSAQESPSNDFVTMIAPNGQTKNVRKEQVQKYLAKGATIKE